MAGSGSAVTGSIRAALRWRCLLVVIIIGAAALGITGCAAQSEEPEKVQLEGPALALQQLAEAAQDGEWTGVRTYMDASAVGLSFAQATMARLSGGSDDTGTPSAAMPGHGSDLPVSVMESTFAEQFVANLQTSVEGGTAVAEGTLFGTLLADGAGEIEYVSDDEALVSVTVPVVEAGEETVRLRMVRSGQRWMLIAVENTAELYGLFF